MNAHVSLKQSDLLGADSAGDYLADTVSLAHLLLMAAETLKGRDGHAMYQGVAQVLDRLNILFKALDLPE